MVDLLLKNNADLSIIAEPGGTPLMIMVSSRRLEAAETLIKSDPSVIDFMVTGASDVSNNYYAAIHYSAWYGYVQGIKLLVEYGADFSLVTWCGNNAVSLAAHSDCIECVRYLLSLGCDANQQDRDGDTALLYATYNANPRIIEALLKHGADPSLSNNAGITPLWNSVYSRSLPAVNLLLSLNVDPRKPSRGHNIYGDHGAEDNCIYDQSVSPLFVAIHHENLSIVKALISAGCDINGERYSTSDMNLYVQHWEEPNKRWLEHVMSTTPSLAWWCKRTIRHALLPVRPDPIINALDIPSTLKTYIKEV